MKLLQSAIIRALTAIVIGALIIKYREETVQWLTICIGVLFLITGLISCAVYFKDKKQVFPIVGVGSIALGVILAVMPTQFVEGLTYVLAAMLILGAVNEYVSLARALRVCEIGWFYWLLPSIILVIAILVILNPKQLLTAPLFILGWCMILYGVADGIVAFMSYKTRKLREAEEAAEQKRLEEQAKLEEEARQKAEEESNQTETGEDNTETEAETEKNEETEQTEISSAPVSSGNNISFVDEGHEIEIEPE